MTTPADRPPLRGRYRRIMRFAMPLLVASWWYEVFLPTIGLSRVSDRVRTRRLVTMMRRYRPLALELGGLMIKVGQFLSSRLDVMPPEAAAELASLQDEVSPVPFTVMRASAEASLGRGLSDVFASVDETPLAAASLGQAHRARLHPQDAEIAGFADVVVKIQRPGIDEIVETDLAALRRIARLLMRTKLIATRMDAPALVDEFAAVSRDELDYPHEARNAARFAENIEERAGIAAPGVAWEILTRRVLVLEDVSAIKITDIAALRDAGIDPSDVADSFGTAMLDQLFRDGFFHADPHPGNVFVTPTADGFDLTFIDFGMMAEIDDTLRGGLRRIVVAIATRDSAALVAAVRDVGMLLPTADVPQLEKALAALFDRFGGMGFGDLQNIDPNELRTFAADFGDVMRTLPFQLPENFLLIFRAASLTSGVCSALDPQFNIWDAVDPYAKDLLRQEGGGALKAFTDEAVASAGILARLPRRVDALITKLDEGRLVVDTRHLERQVDSIARRGIAGLVFAGLVIAGAVVHSSDAVLGSVLMLVSAVPGLYALASLWRR